MAIRIHEHVPLRELTTLKVGGTARFFCSVSTEQNLKTAFRFARKKKLPVVVLGGGSNVLLSDKEIDAVVVKNEIRGVEWESPLIKGALRCDIGGGLLQPPAHRNASAPFVKGDTVLVIAGAGENWDGLVEQAVTRGLWGIENLSGIPGTVGAAPIQNIGAYGTEIKDVLEWVEAFDTKTGKVRRISNRECFFGYRDSLFKKPKGKGLVITRVALRLSKNGAPNLEYKDLKSYLSPSLEGEIKEGVHPYASQARHFPSKEGQREHPTLPAIRQAVLEIRAKKFPDLRTHGTAGSFFKNPIISQKQFDTLKKRFPDLPGFELRIKDEGLRIKVSLAWILDNICGLKGYRKGNVALFERQPIVLVQDGDATSEEVIAFAKDIAEQVREKVGITIEWEVQKMQ